MLKRSLWNGLVAGSVGLQMVAWPVVRADDGDEQTRSKKENVAIAVIEEVTANDADKDHPASPEASLPKLWLGIALKGVEGDLAAYLGSSSGVLIDQVQPESPAAKCGLHKGDVVLAVDGKEIEGPEDLLNLMSTLKEGTGLKLKVLRKMEHMEISVTPEPRPAVNLRVATVEGSPMEFEFEEGQPLNLDLHLRSLGIEPGASSDEKVYMFRLGDPSVAFVPDKVELQGNISIQMTKETDGQTVEVKISKESEKPAKITIKQGDQVQELTEDQLDKLPEELRGWVQSALTGNKSKWLELKDRSAVIDIPYLPGARIDVQKLGEIKELKELSKLLDSEQMSGKKEELQKMVEELTKNAKAQAQEALRKAMEQAGVEAEDTAKGAKQLALEYAEQVVQSAKKQAEKAKAEVQAAYEKAQAESEELKQAAQKLKQSEEVAELKAMIEELRKEIAELRGSK